jgi:probable AcnD-accessory protein PrpF
MTEQLRIPAVIMRGATSKGLFFRHDDLPFAPDLRDRIILRALGSPDPYGRQLDGLGGATSSTSKVAIISPSPRNDCDVDYLFGQVGIERNFVDFSGSCGNLAAAVGHFAIEEGFVRATDPLTLVRIWQVNTSKRIVAYVPTENGLPLVEGDYRIDGVPNSGAEIRLEFFDPGGSCTGKLLPTGNVVDELQIPGIGKVSVSLVDASNPVVFVLAQTLGLRGTELGEEVNSDLEILDRLEQIRAHGAVVMGLAGSPEEATLNCPAIPKVAFIAPPQTYQNLTGEVIDGAEIDLVARIISMNKLHGAYTVTGAIGTAVASMLPGTLVHRVARTIEDRSLRIGHSAGIMKVGVCFSQENGNWVATKGVVGRTARRMMEGWIRVPASVLECHATGGTS